MNLALPIAIAPCLLSWIQVPRVPASSSAERVEVRARVLDEDSKPLANQDLAVDVCLDCRTENGSSNSSKDAAPRTDADGRFTIQVDRGTSAGCTRSLLVRKSWRNVQDWVEELQPSKHIDLPDEISAPVLDLGDVRIAAACSPRRFAPLRDEELQRAVSTCRDTGKRDGERYLEGLLCEIVRRGGKKWEAFLTHELRRELPLPPDGFKRRWETKELEVLTALRRVQQKPDPLAIEVRPESQLDAEYPDSPLLSVDLANRDPESATLMITLGGGYRSGRLERWRIDVRTLDGTPVAPIEWGVGMAGGLSTERTLAPGESLEQEIPISNYALVPVPGVYEARVLYHDQESICDLHDLGNLVLASSPWTRFEVRSRRIVLTALDKQRIREVVDSVKDPEQVLLLRRTYRPDWTFAGAPKTPEEALCTFGWKSLTVLFEVLDEPTLSPRRRAWVLAQLYNLTGLHDPARAMGVLERFSYAGGAGKIGMDSAAMFFPDGGEYGRGSIDEQAQRAFAERWKPIRAAFQFELVK